MKINCCQLAKEQSFGFFHDILDEHWRLAQQIHAQSFPNHYNKDHTNKYSHALSDRTISSLQKSQFWYAENFQQEFNCPYSQRLPPDSDPDGPKWICE